MDELIQSIILKNIIKKGEWVLNLDLSLYTSHEMTGVQGNQPKRLKHTLQDGVLLRLKEHHWIPLYPKVLLLNPEVFVLVVIVEVASIGIMSVSMLSRKNLQLG